MKQLSGRNTASKSDGSVSGCLVSAKRCPSLSLWGLQRILVLLCTHVVAKTHTLGVLTFTCSHTPPTILPWQPPQHAMGQPHNRAHRLVAGLLLLALFGARRFRAAGTAAPDGGASAFQPRPAKVGLLSQDNFPFSYEANSTETASNHAGLEGFEVIAAV